MITRRTNEKNVKLGQRGPDVKLTFVILWPLLYLWNSWS